MKRLAALAVLAGTGEEYEGNVYQPPAPGSPMGAGGQQLFSYARPFEPGEPPAKTQAFGVTVK